LNCLCPEDLTPGVKTEHDHLEAMVNALDASLICFERPVCRGFTGDWQITGKLGHILAIGLGPVEERLRRSIGYMGVSRVVATPVATIRWPHPQTLPPVGTAQGWRTLANILDEECRGRRGRACVVANRNCNEGRARSCIAAVAVT
jgi:hypothetical protein